MANFRIVSNNPMVFEKYPLITTFLDTDVEGIFKNVRDSVHKGSVLINHPLSGSIKPNESPYKSLVFSNQKETLDMFSLQLIEGAFGVLKKLPSKNRNYNDRILNDFQVIDLDLLDSAIDSLPADYHM